MNELKELKSRVKLGFKDQLFSEKMVYLLGVNLPDDKKVAYALTNIYGIGISKGLEITHKLCIHPQCRLKDVPASKMTQLSALLNGMTIETDLKRQVEENLRKLVRIGTLRGHKYIHRRPVKGQSTRSNGKTAYRLNGTFLKKTSSSYSTVSKLWMNPTPWIRWLSRTL